MIPSLSNLLRKCAILFAILCHFYHQKVRKDSYRKLLGHIVLPEVKGLILCKGGKITTRLREWFNTKHINAFYWY